MPHNLPRYRVTLNLATPRLPLLTPATCSPAHERPGLPIIQKGPHGLADRHARRLLVRVHQLRGDHPRILGYHRVPPVLLLDFSLFLSPLALARLTERARAPAHTGRGTTKRNTRTTPDSNSFATEFHFRRSTYTLHLASLYWCLFLRLLRLRLQQVAAPPPTVGSSAPPG